MQNTPSKISSKQAKHTLRVHDLETEHRSPTQQTGDQGEADALLYLERQGLRLIKKNYACRHGEIDLIMEEDRTLVFIEVRMRKNGAYGGAIHSVTPAKIRRLKTTAEVYLYRYRVTPMCRFDLITIENGQLSWIKNIVID